MMNKNKLGKIISIFLILAVVLSLATASNLISAFVENESETDYLETEELKIVNFEDLKKSSSYADDRVIIILNNEKSLNFKKYEKSDFQELNISRLTDLTEETGVKLKNIIDSTKNISSNRELKEKVEKYNQMLCLELAEPGKDKVIEAIKILQEMDGVIYAGPDVLMSACSATPNDSFYGTQWAHERIQTPLAWEYTTGSPNVIVGVLDGGIDGTHEDLISVMEVSLCRDFSEGGAVSVAPTDGHGHGTYVAGIIAAKGNNSVGVCGVAWNIKLASLKVLDDNGYGFSSYAIRAINYAESQNIKILNFSIRWYGENIESQYDVPMRTAISNYSGLFVCAAGNEGTNNDITEVYPTNYKLDNLISVAASSQIDTPWVDEYNRNKRTNYGQSTVDIFAPGEQVRTTAKNNTYAYVGATSYATPHVTGVAALLLSKYPNMTPEQIKATIMANVDPVPAFENLCVSGGMLNAYNAITNPITHNHTYQCEDYGDLVLHKKECSCGFMDYEEHTWRFGTVGVSTSSLITPNALPIYYCTVCDATSPARPPNYQG